MIETVEITKRYHDGFTAVNRVSLRVDPGEVYCLLGPNGSGKTTTINMILNLIEPTRGSAFINGINVCRDPMEAKKHVGYVPENVMLYGYLSARQNVRFFGRLGKGLAVSKDDCYRALDRVGLPADAHEGKLRNFSKGMRQRTGIAIALLRDAPALIMDEPTSGLDPQAADDLMALLLSLKAEGRAILMCTHDVFRAGEVADRVGIMKGGRLASEADHARFAHSSLGELYVRTMAGDDKETEIALGDAAVLAAETSHNP